MSKSKQTDEAPIATVQQAILKISALHQAWNATPWRERPSGDIRSGQVSIDVGGIQRGIKPCPHCGAMTNMGLIIVRHDDGRGLGFDPALYHYAQAGHPITQDDVDGDVLLSIMADA
jgi:hypothetical protein